MAGVDAVTGRGLREPLRRGAAIALFGPQKKVKGGRAGERDALDMNPINAQHGPSFIGLISRASLIGSSDMLSQRANLVIGDSWLPDPRVGSALQLYQRLA